jgi:hypothetical protein
MAQAFGTKKVAYPATVHGRSCRDGTNVAMPHSGCPAISVLVGKTFSGDPERPGTVDTIDHCRKPADDGVTSQRLFPTREKCDSYTCIHDSTAGRKSSDFAVCFDCHISILDLSKKAFLQTEEGVELVTQKQRKYGRGTVASSSLLVTRRA